MYKMKLSSDGGSYDTDGITLFVPFWENGVSTGNQPASFFNKTQYTIENVDIKLLEEQRDHVFRTNPQLYQWPDGTPSHLPQPQVLVYPEGMKLANNDDQRWTNFHSDWVNTNVTNQVLLNGISSTSRAYEVGTEAATGTSSSSVPGSTTTTWDQIDINTILNITPSTAGDFDDFAVGQNEMVDVISAHGSIEGIVQAKTDNFLRVLVFSKSTQNGNSSLGSSLSVQSGVHQSQWIWRQKRTWLYLLGQ